MQSGEEVPFVKRKRICSSTLGILHAADDDYVRTQGWYKMGEWDLKCNSSLTVPAALRFFEGN